MRNKAELEERWREIYNEFKEDMPKRESLYKDTVRNANFGFTAIWSSHLAGMAKFEYLLNKNIKLFQEYFKKSVLIEQELFEHYDKGDAAHPSYVTMLGYQKLFQALATGDMELAKNFASHLGGRDKIEKENDVPFVIDFGYTLKYFVENADVKTKKAWLEKFMYHCTHNKRFSTFLGYGIVFEAILENDSEKANLGFMELVKGHQNECKARDSDRHFRGAEDEDICIWGIGLANLAIYNGLNVVIDDPLIPNELLLSNKV